MSRIGKCLIMLNLLSSQNRFFKIKELAEKLETNERSIRRYKEDLEQAGIYIETQTGRYGGYKYSSKNRYYLKLLPEEIRA